MLLTPQATKRLPVTGNQADSRPRAIPLPIWVHMHSTKGRRARRALGVFPLQPSMHPTRHNPRALASADLQAETPPQGIDDFATFVKPDREQIASVFSSAAGSLCQV